MLNTNWKQNQIHLVDGNYDTNLVVSWAIELNLDSEYNGVVTMLMPYAAVKPIPMTTRADLLAI
jgi:hypothetical protein